jgi:hypothetical protein
MSAISGLSYITPSDIYADSATPGEGIMIGQMAVDGKTGRYYRYALAGELLVMGNLLQASVEAATYINMAVATAGVVGDNSLAITNGTATITALQFFGGTLSVYTAGTMPVGDQYTITGLSGVLTTGGAMSVSLDRPLRYAVTTSAKVNLKQSPWSKVIQCPITTLTEMCVGAVVYPIRSGYYGWVQTHGECTVLSDGSTFAVGSDLRQPGATAGSAGVYLAGTGSQRIGIARTAAASTHGIPIFLQID